MTDIPACPHCEGTLRMEATCADCNTHVEIFDLNAFLGLSIEDDK